MGIFSVALASAVLPTLSGLANKKDIPSIKKTLVFSLENIFFIMCPTTIILLLLSKPIIRALFERGEFDAYSTDITSSALAFYALGLFSFGGIKILVTAFHALQDTKTPVKIAAICLTINATLNFVLMGPLKVGGIALASAIAGTIDFLALLYIIEKKLGGLNSGLLKYFWKVTVAAGITGLVEYWAWNHIFLDNEVLKLFLLGGLGFVFYEFVCLGLGIKQAHKIWEWIKEIVEKIYERRRED
jgi:putative peptidoglycan lipid II flippase